MKFLKNRKIARKHWAKDSMFQKPTDPTKASLKYILHSEMAKTEPGRPYTTLHASDLTSEDFCPQAFVAARDNNLKPESTFVGTSLRATFDTGHALQDLLNTKWAVDTCIGTWQCVACGWLQSFCHRPDSCQSCDCQEFMYVEEVFEAFGASGSVDYILDTGDQYVIVEVKTIVKDDFRTLKTALAEHRLRTLLYLELVANCGDERAAKIDTSYAIVLYICKGFGCKDDFASVNGLKDAPFSPFKEFLIDRDTSTVSGLIKLAKSTMPGEAPIKACLDVAEYQRKRCRYKQYCWRVGGEEE